MTKGEFELIQAVQAMFPHAAEGEGIGDDACVIPGDESGHDILVSTDTLAEGVHFDRRYTSFEDIGEKSCAANASDIFAMGGEVAGYVCALSIPTDEEDETILAFYRGFKRGITAYGGKLLGGDTTSSKYGLFISISVIGRVEHKGALLRSGAQPGDTVYVLGRLGESAYGLRLLQTGARDVGGQFIRAHAAPQLHTRMMNKLKRRYAITAAIDISDGLASDAAHIESASGVGMHFERDADWHALSRLFDEPGLSGEDAMRYVLDGGEDYAVLFTSPDDIQITDAPFARIGRVVNEAGLAMLEGDGSLRRIVPGGYTHF
jgi:thiamine-monophosphate kinase